MIYDRSTLKNLDEQDTHFYKELVSYGKKVYYYSRDNVEYNQTIESIVNLLEIEEGKNNDIIYLIFIKSLRDKSLLQTSFKNAKFFVNNLSGRKLMIVSTKETIDIKDYDLKILSMEKYNEIANQADLLANKIRKRKIKLSSRLESRIFARLTITNRLYCNKNGLNLTDF